MSVKIKITYNLNNGETIVQEYGSESISNLVAGLQISGDNSTPTFGLIGQYGNVKIKDKSQLIEKYYNLGLLEKNAYIQIYYNNNNLIREYYSNNIDYEVKDHIFSFTFKEGALKDFENINVSKIFYQENVSAMTLFTRLFNYTGFSSYKMDEEVSGKLSSINIKNYYYEGGNLLETFNKFCELTMTCIIVKANEIEVLDYV